MTATNFSSPQLFLIYRFLRIQAPATLLCNIFHHYKDYTCSVGRLVSRYHHCLCCCHHCNLGNLYHYRILFDGLFHHCSSLCDQRAPKFHQHEISSGTEIRDPNTFPTSNTGDLVIFGDPGCHQTWSLRKTSLHEGTLHLNLFLEAPINFTFPLPIMKLKV